MPRGGFDYPKEKMPRGSPPQRCLASHAGGIKMFGDQ